MIQRNGQELQSVYPAIIEPYAGDPFIVSARELATGSNERDAMRPVAIEVKTANGRTDVCFSDPNAQTRHVGDITVAAKFAYVSRDARGLRMAHLVEGTRLATKWGELKLAKREAVARVVKVDFWKRKLWLDAALPDGVVGHQVEIGNAEHRTAFRVATHEVTDARSVVTFVKAADLSYAHVKSVDVDKNRVAVNVGPLEGQYPGMDAGLTITNEDLSKAWKCRVLGRQGDVGYVYELIGGLDASDFTPGDVLRLWEYGVGDQARLPASAVVRREGEGGFRVESLFEAKWTPTDDTQANELPR